MREHARRMIDQPAHAMNASKRDASRDAGQTVPEYLPKCLPKSVQMGKVCTLLALSELVNVKVSIWLERPTVGLVEVVGIAGFEPATSTL